ncbi:MAG: undecaprenyl-diphosphate phosphatase [Sporomusaceae bacterium]|nr:undecaprenyl-diphosphate phosphatase [Sporomusaceae bacterium]
MIIAVILGIVEGITEFLPISSTGHMILTGHLLDFDGPEASVFEVFIQLGAILAVVMIYRDQFRQILTKSHGVRKGLTIKHVAAGILPVMAVGYVAHHFIKTYLFSTGTVIIGMIVGALFMLYAEKRSGRPTVTKAADLTIRQAMGVGLFQILALWPGFSRSGATIAGGLCLGVSRMAAAEFSFIIAVPLMMVACIYDVLKVWQSLSMENIQMLAVGFVVSFVVAWAAVLWLLKFLNRSSLAAFAYYRFLLAAVSTWYFFF